MSAYDLSFSTQPCERSRKSDMDIKEDYWFWFDGDYGVNKGGNQ